MVNNKKLKGKHRRQTTADLFMPAPPPPAAVPKKYGLDYARFDAVDSDDSDAARQALAAPEALGESSLLLRWQRLGAYGHL